MTIQEAINVIDKYTTPDVGIGKPVIDAHKIAKAALEKQLPKSLQGEPCHVKAFDGENQCMTYECYPCPTCKKWISANPNHNYCEWCGQKLDWIEK